MKYHNEIRTHLSLEKDAPVSRAVKLAGTILWRPVLGGLHDQYVRICFPTGTGTAEVVARLVSIIEGWLDSPVASPKIFRT